MDYTYSTPLNYGDNVPLNYNQDPQAYGVQAPIPAPEITNGDIAIYEGQPANVSYPANIEAPAAYYPEVYYVNKKGSPLLTGTVAGATAAGITAVATYKKNSSITKDGNIKDSFVENVYDYYTKNYKPEDAKLHKQRVNILNKIDKAKTKADLQKLADSNKEVFTSICESTFKESPKEYIKSLNDNNIKNAGNIIKGRVQNDINNNYNLMKDNIENCLDVKTKKYVQADNVTDDIFKSIEKCSNRTYKILRNSAIAAVAAGVVAGLVHKFIIRHE